jgi:hypothetical protein
MADIVFDTTALPDAVCGRPYSAAVAYHGNATVLIAADSALAAVTNGAADGTTNLPGGLAINTTTNGTVISGTPTLAHGAGSYSLKVTLQDTAGAQQSGAITINVWAAEYDLAYLESRTTAEVVTQLNL